VAFPGSGAPILYTNPIAIIFLQNSYFTVAPPTSRCWFSGRSDRSTGSAARRFPNTVSSLNFQIALIVHPVSLHSWNLSDFVAHHPIGLLLLQPILIPPHSRRLIPLPSKGFAHELVGLVEEILAGNPIL
jgi:hypothetical protein